jgi:sugar/nucleoside kinase (ribokinase family)
MVIASLGELLVEFVAEARDTRHLAPTTYVGPFASGAPAIFIDQAARLGAKTAFAGAVGQDAFGTVIIERLADVGVDLALVRRVERPTGSAFVAYNSDGSRLFVFNIAHSAAALLPGAEAIAAGFARAGVRVVHVSGSTLGDPQMRRTALDVCRRHKAAGGAISIDPNVRAELVADAGYGRDLAELVGAADYVLPSDADAEMLFPGEDFDAYAARLIAGGARVVALKRGEHGARGVTAAGESVEVEGHRVTVADPTGAGDCFCGTLVAALAGLGKDFSTAMRLANAAGALAVQKVGPMEGNSDLSALARFLEGQA